MPDEVADWMEPDFKPGLEELVGAVPAIETDAVAIRFEHPFDFGEGRLEPFARGVVLDLPPITGAVVHQVRWISEDEIYALGRGVLEDVDAVAVDGFQVWVWRSHRK